jgi:hypothetical protein
MSALEVCLELAIISHPIIFHFVEAFARIRSRQRLWVFIVENSLTRELIVNPLTFIGKFAGLVVE